MCLFLILIEECENVVPGLTLFEPCFDDLPQLLKIPLCEIKLIPFGSVVDGVLFWTAVFSDCCA